MRRHCKNCSHWRKLESDATEINGKCALDGNPVFPTFGCDKWRCPTPADEMATYIRSELETMGVTIPELPLDQAMLFVSKHTEQKAGSDMVRCHSGHVSPRALWNCPVCVADTLKENERLKRLESELRALNDKLKAKLDEACDSLRSLRRLRTDNAKLLQRLAELEHPDA